MVDLFLGMLLLAVASAVALAAGLYVERQLSYRACDTLAIGVVLFAGIYGHSIWQRVALAELFPFSNLIVVANWFPIFAAFIIGLAWKRIPGGHCRRCLPSLALYLTAWFAVVTPILGESPRCDDVWTEDGFCAQSTEHTCTAASAASLLRLCGIEATEQEMADLCLTRTGTTWQGLYRGLKLKTEATDWDVSVVRGDVGDLVAASSSPMILSVGLEWGREVDGAYEREFGWAPGLRHSVLMLSADGADRVEIADPNPDIGREIWTVDELSLLYRGPALQLVQRKETPSS
ncbi:MAG: hypothetical protein H6822_02985 [Planctomycetaceae bacterium]|nr:hypothetical protein [Planctomycetales bacterium]MCB9921117.1 hypothetical protein [Planctomycetaceae bacterium]